MNTVKIMRVEEKCNNCGLCVRDCIAGVLRMEDGCMTVAAPELCNRCSHCLAVCPQRAIEHEGLNQSQIRAINKSLLDGAVYQEIILSRRSIRDFKDQEVAVDLIEKIIATANYSPTASNLQNVEYMVIMDQDRIRETARRIFAMGEKIYAKSRTKAGRVITTAVNWAAPDGMSRYADGMDYYIKETRGGRDFILHNAPVVLLLMGPKHQKFISDNCVLAAANITNHAHALGLGTCHIGFLTLTLSYIKSLRRLLEVPDNKKVYASLIMGYPAYQHSFTVSRKKAKINWIMKKND